MVEQSSIIRIGNIYPNTDAFIEFFNENSNSTNIYKGTESLLLKFNIKFNTEGTDSPLFLSIMPLVLEALTLLQAHYTKGQLEVHNLIISKMHPGGYIAPHVDLGECFYNTHRCHWIIKTNEDVEFIIGNTTLPHEHGGIFQINNVGDLHHVRNNGTEPRYHVIIDVYSTK
jgi:hypothetical protein